MAEVEKHTGERRSPAMSECEEYSVRYPHPKCNDVAVLQATVELNQEANKEALELKSNEIERRLDELNHNFKQASEDRGRFFTIFNHEIYKESVTKDLKEIKKIIDRNSDRLTIIETAAATRDETIKTMLSDERNKNRNALVVLGLIMAAFDLMLRFWKPG